MRKADLSTTRLLDLRHTAATAMLTSGIDPTTVAAILGHSSPTVTLQVILTLYSVRSAVQSTRSETISKPWLL